MKSRTCSLREPSVFSLACWILAFLGPFCVLQCAAGPSGFSLVNGPGTGVILPDAAGDSFRIPAAFKALSSISSVTPPASCVPASERAALIALYDAAGGPNWTDATNWLSADESTWYGVTVTGCEITDIDLSNNNLIGTIPTEIGDLPNLSSLRLSNNQLSGPLPSTITNLTNLGDLFVDYNQLSGSLPSNIGDMVTLGNLDIQFNAFSGSIPSSLGDCSLMENIVMESNQLTGSIPASLGQLTGLFQINLGSNHLTGSIPPELGDLTQMDFFTVGGNDLTGPIPSELGNLTLLTSLDLSENQLTGSIPPELGQLTLLTFLVLGPNQLTGTIPSELGNLTGLTFLRLSGNHLSGSIPPSFGHLTNLYLLEMDHNGLTGSIPPELGQDVLLQYLALHDNQLDGTIPTELGNIPTLQNLSMDNNLLTGSLPASLGNLPNLTAFGASHNQLTGSIPSELGQDIKLKHLDLYENQLTGSIPPELGDLSELEELFIYSNQLTGSLPKELGQCTKLRTLGVGGNQLTGSLPVELQSLTQLETFSADDNEFTGNVPDEYLAWTNIQQLYLQSDHFTAIPAFPSGSITDYAVENNNLEFDDLEPNIGTSGFTYAPQADLPGGTASVYVGSPLLLSFSTGGTSNQYQWYKDGILIGGATSPDFSIASTALSDAGDYTVSITSTIVPGLTLQSQPFSVTVLPVIDVTTQPADVSLCDGSVALLSVAASGTSNLQYQWQYSADGVAPFTNITEGGGYSNVTTSSLSVNTTGGFGAGHYRTQIDGDLAVTVLTNEAILTVAPLPAAPGVTPGINCSGKTVVLGASGGTDGDYRWYDVAAGGTPLTGETGSSYTTPPITATTTYYVSISDGTCESPRTAVDATITGPCPAPPVISAIPLNAKVGGLIVVDLVPLITTIGTLDINSIQVVDPPASGATTSITNGVLTINYEGISFAGKESLTIEACDNSGSCATQEFEIEIEGELLVYNAISPNHDGIDDFFYVENISILPETVNNKVTIFNRWGDKVWSGVNYDNTSVFFEGLNNNGKELPTGIYYYKIEFAGTRKPQTGFLFIKR